MESLKKQKAGDKEKTENPFGHLTRKATTTPSGIEKLLGIRTTISTIIFDLSEVQITGLTGVEKTLEPLLNIGADQILGKLAGDDIRAFFHGQISEEEYLNRIIAKNGWKISNERLKSIIRENFREIEGTRQIIEKLKSNGFKLGLISVHGKEWIDYANQKFDYHRLFDSVMYSFEIALSKPDKKAYRLMMEKLDSKPEECIFIDDQQKNLDPAIELGMKAILFKNAGQLEKDLRQMGIQI